MVNKALRKKQMGATRVKRQRSVKSAPRVRTHRIKLDITELTHRIQEEAYWLYLDRGQSHGNDREDWYKAEELVLSGK